ALAAVVAAVPVPGPVVPGRVQARAPRHALAVPAPRALAPVLPVELRPEPLRARVALADLAPPVRRLVRRPGLAVRLPAPAVSVDSVVHAVEPALRPSRRWSSAARARSSPRPAKPRWWLAP